MIPESRALCILGMHRSGTSLLTRLVNIRGVYVGEEDELIPPLPDNNPEGFWERKDFNEIHTALLGRFKRTWDTVLPLPGEWFSSPHTGTIRKQLLAIAGEKLCPRGFWAWKDPRTMLVLPMWQDILRELGVTVSYIFVFRNPLDVARSLAKRDSMTLQRGISIWFNYNICALKALRGLPVAFVTYESLLRDSENEMARCAGLLNVEWPVDDAQAKALARSFVRPELCHSASAAADLESHGVHKAVSELFGLLNAFAAGKGAWSSGATEEVDNLYTAISSFSYFCQEELRLIWDCNDERRRLNDLVCQQNKLLTDQQGQIVSQQSENNALAQTNVALEQNLKWQGRALESKEHALESMRNSLSWRITGPARWMRSRLMHDDRPDGESK